MCSFCVFLAVWGVRASAGDAPQFRAVCGRAARSGECAEPCCLGTSQSKLLIGWCCAICVRVSGVLVHVREEPSGAVPASARWQRDRSGDTEFVRSNSALRTHPSLPFVAVRVCIGVSVHCQEWIGLLISLSFVLPHLCIILSTQFVQVRIVPLPFSQPSIDAGIFLLGGSMGACLIRVFVVSIHSAIRSTWLFAASSRSKVQPESASCFCFLPTVRGTNHDLSRLLVFGVLQVASRW